MTVIAIITNGMQKTPFDAIEVKCVMNVTMPTMRCATDPCAFSRTMPESSSLDVAALRKGRRPIVWPIVIVAVVVEYCVFFYYFNDVLP